MSVSRGVGILIFGYAHDICISIPHTCNTEQSHYLLVTVFSLIKWNDIRTESMRNLEEKDLQLHKHLLPCRNVAQYSRVLERRKKVKQHQVLHDVSANIMSAEKGNKNNRTQFF